MRVRHAMLVACCMFASSSAWADLYVIVHGKNNIPSISSDELARLYLRKAKRFSNGIEAMPLSQSVGSSARNIFNARVLERNEQQLKYYWSRRMFSGGDKPPAAVGDDAAVIGRVSQYTGAIGYVSKKPADSKVRVVLEITDGQ